MKKLILTLMVVFMSTLAVAQKLDISVGASVFAPIGKDVNSDARAWGQRVQLSFPKNETVAYTLTLGYQQSKDKFVQMPVLAGVRIKTYKNLHVGVGTGATFLKNENPRFTITPSIGYKHKRWYFEQSIFRTTKFYNLPLDGEHFNNIGFSVLYQL